MPFAVLKGEGPQLEVVVLIVRVGAKARIINSNLLLSIILDLSQPVAKQERAVPRRVISCQMLRPLLRHLNQFRGPPLNWIDLEGITMGSIKHKIILWRIYWQCRSTGPTQDMLPR